MATSSDKTEIAFFTISKLYGKRWKDNAKLHDVGGIAQSIRVHGLIEPPRYDREIDAVVAGNGRVEALWMMWRGGEEPPRGVTVTDDGDWVVPVVVGVGFESRDMASVYVIDSNNLVLSGGGMSATQAAKMWEPGVYELQLVNLALKGISPVSVDADSLDSLLRLRKIKDKENKETVNPVARGDLYRLGNVVVEVMTIEQFLDIINVENKSISGKRIVVIGFGAIRQWEQANGRMAKKLD